MPLCRSQSLLLSLLPLSPSPSPSPSSSDPVHFAGEVVLDAEIEGVAVAEPVGCWVEVDKQRVGDAVGSAYLNNVDGFAPGCAVTFRAAIAQGTYALSIFYPAFGEALSSEVAVTVGYHLLQGVVDHRTVLLDMARGGGRLEFLGNFELLEKVDVAVADGGSARARKHCGGRGAAVRPRHPPPLGPLRLRPP